MYVTDLWKFEISNIWKQDLTQVSKYHINFNNIYFFQSSVTVNQTKYDVKYFCKMTKAPLTYGK